MRCQALEVSERICKTALLHVDVADHVGAGEVRIHVQDSAELRDGRIVLA